MSAQLRARLPCEHCLPSFVLPPHCFAWWLFKYWLSKSDFASTMKMKRYAVFVEKTNYPWSRRTAYNARQRRLWTDNTFEWGSCQTWCFVRQWPPDFIDLGYSRDSCFGYDDRNRLARDSLCLPYTSRVQLWHDCLLWLNSFIHVIKLKTIYHAWCFAWQSPHFYF